MRDELLVIAEDCRRYILRHANRNFTSADLAWWCTSYRALSNDDRAWVQVALVKMRELAVSFGAYGTARFQARHTAPDAAFSVADLERDKADAVADALRKTQESEDEHHPH